LFPEKIERRDSLDGKTILILVCGSMLGIMALISAASHMYNLNINSDGLEEVQEDSVIKVLNNEFEKTEIYGTTRCSAIKSAFNHMIAIILNCSE